MRIVQACPYGRVAVMRTVMPMFAPASIGERLAYAFDGGRRLSGHS